VLRVLLDTHAFLWWITDDPRLSERARGVIRSGRNELFLSAASGWEIAIKAGLGRIRLPEPMGSFLVDQMVRNGIEALPVSMRHALHVHTLPPLHRDPFDRMLVAQAQLEDLEILTADPAFSQYAVRAIW
jgi:PIN domain nuclease of toxin-antitoxin system